MMNWSELRNWKSGPIYAAYDEVSRCEQILSDASQGLADAGAALQSEGESASAAREQVQNLRRQADQLEALLTDLMQGCLGAAGKVARIEASVPDVDSFASANELEIHDPGTVVVSAAREAQLQAILSIGDPAAVQLYNLERQKTDSAKMRCQGMVDEVRDRADEADRRFQSVLTSVAAGEVSDVASLLSQLNGEGAGAVFDGKSPGEVHALWQSMSWEEQRAMMAMDPDGLLNRQGLPPEILEEASVVKMRGEVDDLLTRRDEIDEQLKDLEGKPLVYYVRDTPLETEAGRDKRLLEEERNRLNEQINLRQKAIDRGGFVIYDPENGNIVERVHTGREGEGSVKHVITYQHGTGGSYNDVLDGTSGGAARDIARQAGDSPTDLYIHHQGDAIGWVGDNANSNEAFLNNKGAQLADFQESLYVQDDNRGAKYHGIGHSAGNSVVTGSEMHGARYDTVTSLSGSFMPEGWQADPNTDYRHYHYEGEPINAVGIMKDSPSEDPAFQTKQFDSGNDYAPSWTTPLSVPGWVEGVLDAVSSHTASNHGGDGNRQIIDQTAKDIYGN